MQGCSPAHSACLWSEWATNGLRPACAQGASADWSCSPDLPPRENSSGLPGLQREELPHLLPGLCQVGPQLPRCRVEMGLWLNPPSCPSLPHAHLHLTFRDATTYSRKLATRPHTGLGSWDGFGLGVCITSSSTPVLLRALPRVAAVSSKQSEAFPTAVPLSSDRWSPRACPVGLLLSGWAWGLPRRGLCFPQTAGLLSASAGRHPGLFAAAFAPFLPRVLNRDFSVS